MGRHYISGILQLLLAVAGFSAFILWAARMMGEMAREAQAITPNYLQHLWLGKWAAILFGASWFWSLGSSLVLLHRAPADSHIPPKIGKPN